MDTSLLRLNEQIKKEADNILYQQGLIQVLNAYGQPHITGSYFLNLMTWRDLDIYIETEQINETTFFTLGGSIAALLNPVKMSFRNERLKKTPGLPDGLYWGIYLGNEREGAWKIDVWAINKTECNKLISYCKAIEEQLTPEAVLKILAIKSQCWKDPEYRRSYSSMDIYKAVLENGVSTISEFRNYLKVS